ncbi:MAG: 4-deoxy-4-formamido-L-arabinose-phosphoundecaprenol deformylase [Spartobacteria bacterium]|nr:4-deoxy-4-formamido-L-arabinose-phosphoundecaprenol deformylase [Spartobacteria bacterium]
MKQVGLRIDVDTLKGTREGVPCLCDILRKHEIHGTFYFSVGPDNMGRHLWRLLRPAFLIKMLRSNAAGLYGWSILFMGTAWPGPRIGKRCEEQIRRARDEGHEMGLHAWDHQKWQAQIDAMSADTLQQQLRKGVDELTRILGVPPVASAVPGWRCNDAALRLKEAFGFIHNSDCRGTSTFIPVVDGQHLRTPQIPVTLPTYDEVVGSSGITDESYNAYILEQIQDDRLNVLTIHAEAEGGHCARMFDAFLTSAKQQGIQIMPMYQILSAFPADRESPIVAKSFAGREGWLACQQVTSE